MSALKSGGFVRDEATGALLVTGVTGSPGSLIDPLLLRYAPPAQVTPTVVTVPTGDYSGTFGATEDVIFNWPVSTRTGTFLCTGGRNVRVVGGKVVRTGSNASVQFQSLRVSVFFEGIEADNSAVNADFLDVYGVKTGDPSTWTYPDVYIQNVRCTGINGTVGTTHADFFQAQGPVGRLFVDKCTIETNYQGFFIPSQLVNNSSLIAAYFDRVNIRYTPPGDPTHPYTYAFWLLDDDSEIPYPVYFGEEVYIDTTQRPNYNGLLADFAVAPFNSKVADGTGLLPNGTPYGAINDSGGGVYWPASMPFHGRIHSGPPPGGDFVPAGIGTSYVSPGFAGTAPTAPITLGRKTTQALPGDAADDLWLPADYGWKAWTFDVSKCGANGASTAGVVQLTKVKVPRTMSVTNILAAINNTPLTLANGFAGIYDSTGARLGVTADQSAGWAAVAGTATLFTMAISGGPITVQGGDGVFVWVALLNGSSVTAPSFIRQQWSSAGIGNLGLTAATGRAGTILSGQTSLPSSITPGSISITAPGGQFWAALS